MKNNLLLYIIVLILIPIFVVSIIYKTLSNEKNVEQNELTTNKKTDKEIQVKINKNNKILTLNLEDYIVGVVAGEMPASFHIEALKAQAIASRTYAMYKMNNNKNSYDVETTTDDQVYITKEEMQEKWNEEFDYYYKKIRKAVEETKNLIMKKDNKIFKAYYFAMSNGVTADSMTVFNEKNFNSVKSPWDNEELNRFLVTTDFSTKDLESKLNIQKINNIEIISRDKTNRVEKIKVNNKIYSGIEFRKLLSLRSTDFTISKENNIYLITTKGYGHGVGMSQYGANGMAKENYNYKEILEHYYQDIEIEKI